MITAARDMELTESPHRALIISNGNYATFFTHPVSAVFLCAAIVSILYPLIRWAMKRNKKKFPFRSIHPPFRDCVIIRAAGHE